MLLRWYTYGFALVCGLLALAPLDATEDADRPREKLRAREAIAGFAPVEDLGEGKELVAVLLELAELHLPARQETA